MSVIVRVLLSVALLLCVCVGLSDCIACYRCRSDPKESCGGTFTKDGTEKVNDTRYAYCYVLTENDISLQLTFVARGVYENQYGEQSSTDCYQYSADGTPSQPTKRISYCLCNTDLCNYSVAPGIKVRSAAAALSTDRKAAACLAAFVAVTARRHLFA